MRLRCRGRSTAVLILNLTTKRSTIVIVTLIPMIASNAWWIIAYTSTNWILWNALATFMAHHTLIRFCLPSIRSMCMLTMTRLGGAALTAALLLAKMTKSTSVVSTVDHFQLSSRSFIFLLLSFSSFSLFNASWAFPTSQHSSWVMSLLLWYGLSIFVVWIH